MAILLTGASGFIGSHFHNVLPQKDFINLDLVEPTFNYQSTFIKGDIRNESDIVSAVSGKDIKSIISLAAKHHDFGVGHDEYFDTNEDGTRLICKVATEFNINEIIFYSSVAVYGIREEISTEALEPKPDSPYGESKLAGEKVLIKWAAEKPERKVLIIRPTLVFGKNNMANMRNLIKQIDSGLYFHLGKADNVKSIAYVENLVQATLFLKERMKPGVAIYNYADEPQLTTRQISTVIAESLNKKIRLSVPKTLGVMMGLPFDIIIKLTGKNLPISTARIKKLGTATHHSATKVFSEGFQPRYSTTEGLKKMVDWYKGEKK
ncbi:MAG TPA: NAD-dependent epimerase/dehydratase family protein [Chryseolinea sp.]